MQLSVSILIPLALMSAPLPAESEPELSFDAQATPSRFADVLVTSYLCDVLGYKVDYPAIADWGYAIQDRMVSQGDTAEEAMAELQNEVQVKRTRFNSYHAQFVRGAIASYAADFDRGSEALFRFQHTFTDRCDDLIESADAGAFFEAPEERLWGTELARRLRGLVSLNR